VIDRSCGRSNQDSLGRNGTTDKFDADKSRQFKSCTAMRDEVVAGGAVVVLPALIGAWSRKPLQTGGNP